MVLEVLTARGASGAKITSESLLNKNKSSANLMQLEADMAVSPEDFTQHLGCPVLRPPSKKVHLRENCSWLCYFQLKMSIVLALSLESGIESFVWEYR